MAGLRGLGFIFGALGLLFFLGGIVYGLLTPPDPSCSDVYCEKSGFSAVHTRIVFLWGTGLAAAAIALALLVLDLRRRPRALPTAPASRGPASPSRPGQAQRPPASGPGGGPDVRVRPAPPRGPSHP